MAAATPPALAEMQRIWRPRGPRAQRPWRRRGRPTARPGRPPPRARAGAPGSAASNDENTTRPSAPARSTVSSTRRSSPSSPAAFSSTLTRMPDRRRGPGRASGLASPAKRAREPARRRRARRSPPASVDAPRPPAGRAVEGPVVDHHRMAVPRELDVELDHVRTQLLGATEGRQACSPGASRSLRGARSPRLPCGLR